MRMLDCNDGGAEGNPTELTLDAAPALDNQFLAVI